MVQIGLVNDDRFCTPLGAVPDARAAGTDAIADTTEPNQETQKCPRKDALTRLSLPKNRAKRSG